jgi:hypothetical protein
MNNIDKKDEKLEVFLDNHREKIASSVAQIEALSRQIKDNNMSKMVLLDISSELSKVAAIFQQHSAFSGVAPVIVALEKFLEIVNLTFSPQTPPKSLGYLANILDDFNQNLVDMFVDSLYSDVYIFEDSFISNITYMTNSLLGKEQVKDESELELF